MDADVALRPPSSPSPASSRFTVGSDTPERDARSACDQPRSARAAFICRIDTISIDLPQIVTDT